MSAPKPPRKTARIPRSQRKRRIRQVTLGPEAESILKAIENASAYVEHLILSEEQRKKRRKPKKGP